MRHHRLHWSVRALAPALLIAMAPVLAVAEEVTPPDGGDGENLTPEQQQTAEELLEGIARDNRLLREGEGAYAQNAYERGLQALEEGRLDDAINLLTDAVRMVPENEDYRQALSRARTAANLNPDPRNDYIQDIQNEMSVLQQQLWVEAQQHIERGMRHLERGEYTQAEMSFNMAMVRLESLPFADERRERETRRVEVLLAEAVHRREMAELEASIEQADLAARREAELRQYNLQLEQRRLDAMLDRALRAREHRDYDECILLCEQVLKINRAETRAYELLVQARRERHIYLRQITADIWDEQHRELSRHIRESMLPQLDLVVYPDEWPELDMRRSVPEHGLGGGEEAAWMEDVRNQLQQRLTVDFVDTDIVEVVRFLQDNTDVNFVLDPAVTSGGGTPPITMQLENIRLENALDFIMTLTDLRYSLQDEAVYISDEDGLRGDAFMKIYEIDDLIHPLNSFPGPDLEIPEPGGEGSQLIPEIEDPEPPNIDDFIDIIEEVVSPESWDADGVGIDEYQGSLVVSQTADVHREIEELLRTLRNQRGVQINVRVRFLEVENAMLEEIGFNWENFTGPPVTAENAVATVPTTSGPVDVAFLPPGALGPPYAFGGYYQSSDGYHTSAARLSNSLPDYTSNSGLNNIGGASAQFQVFQDQNGFLGRVVINALERTRRGNISVQPDITLFSGQRAHLVRMNQQAYIADYDVSGDQYDPIISILSYGTVLDVEAIASADRRYITMTLQPTDARIGAWRRFGPPLQDFNGGAVDNAGRGVAFNPLLGTELPLIVPQLIYTSVQTSVTIPDGGSLLISGMTRGVSSRAHTGVPFLSHIPFLGRLFSSNGRAEREFKLLILVNADLILFDELEAEL